MGIRLKDAGRCAVSENAKKKNLQNCSSGISNRQYRFSPFLTMFFTLPKTKFNFSVTLTLSSANALNLDQSKILSLGKGLRRTMKAKTNEIDKLS